MQKPMDECLDYLRDHISVSMKVNRLALAGRDRPAKGTSATSTELMSGSRAAGSFLPGSGGGSRNTCLPPCGGDFVVLARTLSESGFRAASFGAFRLALVRLAAGLRHRSTGCRWGVLVDKGLRALTPTVHACNGKAFFVQGVCPQPASGPRPAGRVTIASAGHPAGKPSATRS